MHLRRQIDQFEIELAQGTESQNVRVLRFLGLVVFRVFNVNTGREDKPQLLISELFRSSFPHHLCDRIHSL